MAHSTMDTEVMKEDFTDIIMLGALFRKHRKERSKGRRGDVKMSESRGGFAVIPRKFTINHIISSLRHTLRQEDSIVKEFK